MSCLNEVNNLTNSDSLKQGESFQVRLDNYTTLQENFDTISEPDTNEPEINNTYLENYKNFENDLGEYSTFKSKLYDRQSKYNRRIDRSNIYLNQNIRFPNGKIFHVTNQGVAKYISSLKHLTSILGKNGCGSRIIKLNIPWKDKYLIPGEVIPTNPTLITGTFMKENGSCGNEGNNVRVTRIVSNSSDKYIGCFKNDVKNKSMTMLGNVPNIKKDEYSFKDCKNFAIDGGKKYFALQNVNEVTQKGNCVVSNDIKTAIKNAGVITQNVEMWKADVSPVPSTIAVLTKNGTLNIVNSSGTILYTTSSLVPEDLVQEKLTSNTNYFLIIEDTGDVSIYQGSDILNRQTLIWQTGTNGKTLEKNDNYTAKKCKFGTNIMKSGSSLAPGEFIGSPSGYCYLIMQPDGNLVLYTSKETSGCVTLQNKKQGGLTGINSIYELPQTGDKKQLGSIMYIDQDGSLVKYPSNQIKYGSTFTTLPNYESLGNDIGQCKKSIGSCLQDCAKNPKCYAMNSSKWMKTNNFTKNLYPLENTTMYIKDQTLVENFRGNNKNLSNADTSQLKNYSSSKKNFNDLDKLSTGINSRDVYAQNIKDNNLNSTARTLNTDNSNIKSNLFKRNTSLVNNHKTIPITYNTYNSVQGGIYSKSKDLNNYNRIVSDTNIVLLQENRIYIFLCIMLIICLIIFIRVLNLNKQ